MNHSDNSPPLQDPQPPYGFEFVDGPDHQKILVPTFLVPATIFALNKQKVKSTMKVDDAVSGVRFFIYVANFI